MATGFLLVCLIAGAFVPRVQWTPEQASERTIAVPAAAERVVA